MQQILKATEGNDELIRNRDLVRCHALWVGQPSTIEELRALVDTFEARDDAFGLATARKDLGFLLRGIDPQQAAMDLAQAKAGFDALGEHDRAAVARVILSMALYSHRRWCVNLNLLDQDMNKEEQIVKGSAYE